MAAGIVTVINPLGQIEKARDANRKSDLAQIKNALEIYYHDFGKYPTSSAVYTIVDSDGPADWGTNQWDPYMSMLPDDSTPSKNYVYVNSGPETYYLYASLDKEDDPQACNGGAACGKVPAGVTCGAATDICNYGISSSNVSP